MGCENYQFWCEVESEKSCNKSLLDDLKNKKVMTQTFENKVSKKNSKTNLIGKKRDF